MGFALFHVVISVAGDAVTSMAGLESAASRAWAELNQKVKPITKTLACPSYERQSKREREREIQGLNRLSVHHWVRSGTHASQQLTPPTGFLWHFRRRLVQY